MKIKQYRKGYKSSSSNKSFQQEVWESTWSSQTLGGLVNQLTYNPIYWRLKELIKPKDLILEAGCGFGQWVYRLDQLGYKIIGVDFAEKTIKEIKSKYPKLNIKMGDVRKLPFKKNSLDVYLSFGVIEHFEEGPEEVLQEAYRVLKPGGLLFLTVPYLNLPRFLRNIRNKPLKDDNFYQYLYSKPELEKFVKEAGFEIRKVGRYDFINALIRDLPEVYKLIFRKNSKNKKIKEKESIKFSENKPSFWLSEMLYKIDSYVLLIEAYKR